MRVFLAIAALLFGFITLFNNGMLRSAERATESAALIFKQAALAAKPAEEKIQIPIRTVRAGQIANTWQAPRGADRLHQGQDIFAPRGTEVYSATEGYVLRIGENSLGGNIVSVLGAGGRVYYYAHLDEHAPELAVGDLVTPETVLGYVGNAGNARGTPPHLHFGVYTMGGAIDPLSLF